MKRYNLVHKLRDIMGDVRRHGPIAIWHQIKYRLSPAQRAKERRIVNDGLEFDARHGYHTAGVVSLDNLDIVGDREDALHHQPVPVESFNAALDLIDIAPESATFVDLGSGLGRAVLMAAERPFRHLTGVEFAREFHEMALDNLRRREERRGPDPRIRFVHDNAVAFPVPDGPVVYFLFNSFGPPTLNKVMSAIHASWVADPRPIRFIYYNAVHRDAVEQSGFGVFDNVSNNLFTLYAPS